MLSTAVDTVLHGNILNTTPPTIVVSSYRLGDLVLLSLTADEKKALMQDHPNSLGDIYIKERAKPSNNGISNLSIFRTILDRINVSTVPLPDDIAESIVLHLRLGDVVAGNEWHEKQKRPLSIEQLQKMMQSAIAIYPHYKSVYIIGKPFFAHTSSTNYDECVAMSEAYKAEVCAAFPSAIHFNGGYTDIDVMCATQAAVFVQGKGYFSQLICKVRELRGQPCVRC